MPIFKNIFMQFCHIFDSLRRLECLKRPARKKIVVQEASLIEVKKTDFDMKLASH